MVCPPKTSAPEVLAESRGRELIRIDGQRVRRALPRTAWPPTQAWRRSRMTPAVAPVSTPDPGDTAGPCAEPCISALWPALRHPDRSASPTTASARKEAPTFRSHGPCSLTRWRRLGPSNACCPTTARPTNPTPGTTHAPNSASHRRKPGLTGRRPTARIKVRSSGRPDPQTNRPSVPCCRCVGRPEERVRLCRRTPDVT